MQERFNVCSIPRKRWRCVEDRSYCACGPALHIKSGSYEQEKDAVLMQDHLSSCAFNLVKKMGKATMDYVWMEMGTIGRTSELVESGLMYLR